MARQRRRREGRGWFERFLFSFMGPPEIGDLSAPPRPVPAGPAARCTQCGQPYDQHDIVREPGLTYTRCPG